MKVLFIKLTSMGDVIHALPALTDAQRFLPNIQFDFVVEESFQEIPQWHGSVNRVIPVATRRWRKNLLSSGKQIYHAISDLKTENYDVIIDAQGLIKSGMIAKLAKGDRHGFDANSIREPMATKNYRFKHSVPKSMHAIQRIRQLTAKSLAYVDDFNNDSTSIDYGLIAGDITNSEISAKAINQDYFDSRPYIVFLHGTTWRAKEWPLENWQQLAKKLSSSYRVLLPWGTEAECQRATDIAKNIDNVDVLPKLSLSSMAHVIENAQCVVSVDTGLGHLSAALGKPTISIYGPTDTQLVGTVGENQYHMSTGHELNLKAIKKNQPFDYGKVSVDKVYEKIYKYLLF